MNKNLLIILFGCMLIISPAFAQYSSDYQKASCQKVIDDDLKFHRNFADQVRKERSAVANALQLTEEQALCRVEITRKYSALLEDKFQRLYQENIKLRALKAQNASCDVIKTQEKNVNCVKQEIKDIIDAENKEFKKILDHQQRSKLRMIQKLQRKSVKSASHQKDYYKSNPKMRPFAMPKKQTCESN